MSHESPISFEGEIDLDELQRLDPRLVALAHGRIDEEELNELLGRAVEDPTIRRAVEAFWPLDDASKQQSFNRAQATLAAQSRPRASRWAHLTMPAGLAVFLAGVMTWVLVGLQPPAPLPPYALEVRGGYRTLRSTPERLELGRLAPGAPFELVFRPADPVTGPSRAAAFVVDSEDLQRLDVELEVSRSGSVRWRGTVQALLPGRTGEIELVLAVEPGTLAPTEARVQRALDGDPKSVRLARAHLVIDDS